MTRPCQMMDEWLDPTKSFAFPDWPKVHEWVQANYAETAYHAVYCELARDWVRRIISGFPGSMTAAESTHFIVAVPAAANATQCLKQLELYRAQIHEFLAGISLMPWVGKSIVLVIPDQDTFLRYLGDYYGSGQFALPSGVCLRNGYIHFVLPQDNLTRVAPILAHELVHVCVANHSWPLWVEEAVVQAIENKLCGSAPYVLNREIVQRHQRHWTPAKLREFWSGASFFSPDDGSSLSYHLARFLLEAVAPLGRAKLLEFLVAAHRDDSGFAAMQEAMGLTPEELVYQLLERRPPESFERHLSF